MESLNITIEPPITEHCNKCDYEDSRSFSAIRVVCPVCGERSVSFGPRRIKSEEPIYVTSNYGSYNFADPSDKQWNYTIHKVPGEKSASFTVSEELDTDDPIELIIELNDILQKYLYTSQKPKIAALAKMVDDDEFREKQEILRGNKRIMELERELYIAYSQKWWDKD